MTLKSEIMLWAVENVSHWLLGAADSLSQELGDIIDEALPDQKDLEQAYLGKDDSFTLADIIETAEWVADLWDQISEQPDAPLQVAAIAAATAKKLRDTASTLREGYYDE
jgi:hypothetical protein